MAKQRKSKRITKRSPLMTTPSALQVTKYQQVLQRIGKWESKFRRAQNALARLNASRKRYEKLFRKTSADVE